jgi:hypothetical protein
MMVYVEVDDNNDDDDSEIPQRSRLYPKVSGLSR